MIENHPFEPWLPSNAHLLMLGTFPPSPKRWCIPWYYPNYQNDMWRIFGLIFFGDKLHFVDAENKCYREAELKSFLQEKGVAIYDTAQKVIRTKNTASDKDLQVVEPSDLDGMLRGIAPMQGCAYCRTVGHPHLLRALWHNSHSAYGRLCGVRFRWTYSQTLSHAEQ